MKIPKTIKAYCRTCKKHTEQTLKEYKKGKVRTMSHGQMRHIAKTKGYTSKVGAKVKPVKQSKKQKFLGTCKECGKKMERVLPHSKKKAEIKRGE